MFPSLAAIQLSALAVCLLFRPNTTLGRVSINEKPFTIEQLHNPQKYMVYGGICRVYDSQLDRPIALSSRICRSFRRSFGD